MLINSPQDVNFATLRYPMTLRPFSYDLTDWWQHEIRLEQVLPIDPTKRYPICVAGKRRGPIEDCGGAFAFMELQDEYPLWKVMPQFAQLLLDHRDDGTIPKQG